MKVILIPDTIYNTTIYIIPTYKPSELIKYFKKTHGFAYEDDNTVDGMHFSLENKEAGTKDHFIILKKFENSPAGVALLFHEIYHLVHSVMRDVGMIPAEGSEEAFAYYAQYLTTQILNKIV